MSGTTLVSPTPPPDRRTGRGRVVEYDNPHPLPTPHPPSPAERHRLGTAVRSAFDGEGCRMVSVRLTVRRRSVGDPPAEDTPDHCWRSELDRPRRREPMAVYEPHGSLHLRPTSVLCYLVFPVSNLSTVIKSGANEVAEYSSKTVSVDSTSEDSPVHFSTF